MVWTALSNGLLVFTAFTCMCNVQTAPQQLQARVGAIERRLNTLVNQIGSLEYALEIEREHRTMLEGKINITVDEILNDVANLTGNEATRKNDTLAVVEELIRLRLSTFEGEIGLLRTEYDELSRQINSTRDPPPIQSPTNVTATALNSTSIMVTWQSPSSVHTMSGFNVYFVAVNKNGSHIGPERSQTVLGIANTQTTIADLDQSTTYSVHVVGFTESRLSRRSSPTQVTTQAPASNEPGYMYVRFLQDDPPKVRVVWSPPSGTWSGHRLSWGIPGQPFQSRVFGPDVTSAVLDTFEKNLNYEFQIEARSEKGYTEPVTTRVRMPTGRALEGNQVNIERIKGNNLHVTWTMPSYPISGFVVYYREFVPPFTWRDLDVSAVDEVYIANVDSNASYIVHVRAKMIRPDGTIIT